jgi:hypothetical protein
MAYSSEFLDLPMEGVKLLAEIERWIIEAMCYRPPRVISILA